MQVAIEIDRIKEGDTYEQYRAKWDERLRRPTSDMTRTERKYHYYRKYNRDRSRRVHEAMDASTSDVERVAPATQRQTWMVLTEDWCVDSAYLLPVIARVAAADEAIDLRIVERDENLDVMDQFLTNGGRSIPKLVGFDEDGVELFQWGPRPEGARLLREELKAAGASGADVTNALITFYEEGGWWEAAEEIAEQLRSAMS